MAGVGVKVTTSVRRGPSADLVAPSGTYFAVGLTERGPVDAAVEVRSMTDYARLLGDRVPYGALYDDLQTFFEEGGARAYVSRVVGPAATSGSVTLQDGGAVNTLRVDAQNPGAWSADVSVAVVEGATPDLFELQVLYRGVIVEDYVNLASPADAVARTQKSNYVTVTDLGSITAAPGNNPAVVAATSLTAGTDDRAAIVDATRVAAIGRFDPGLGVGAVACPGVSTPNVQQALIAHAATNYRVALLAPAKGTSLAGLAGLAQSFNTTDGGEYAGVFGPWILIPDGAGGTRTISPEGYVAAVRNRAHEQEGPWRAPAGAIAEARFVVGTETGVTIDDANTLDAARASGIRIVDNSVRLYGWRSLSLDDEDWALLKNRDTLNYMSVSLRNLLETEVFATLDGRGHELARMRGICIGFLEPIRIAGGVFELFDAKGSAIDPGYSVDVGPDVNPLTSLAKNQATVQVAARTSPTAALINLNVIQVGLTAPV